MRDLIRQLLARLAAGDDVAYCRLVETRGSTPQKAGAAMLVFVDGTQFGTLGGGCVEAEVKRKALAALNRDRHDQPHAELVTFHLDSDYGWDDGLICGGRMVTVIAPIRSENVPEYFQRLAAVFEQGAPFTEAIIFDDSDNQAVAAASFLIDENSDFLAVWPKAAEAKVPPGFVRAGLKPISKRPRPYCRNGISYLPRFEQCRLVVVGGGHVGAAVAQLASDLDFDVWVTDDRSDIVDESRFPTASRRIAGSVERVLPDLAITPSTYCLIVTRGHNHDEEALYYLIDRGAAYVGMIGSRRKIRLIFDDLLDRGVSPSSLAAVYAPVGLDIGSQSVNEIAISIVAELVAHRNLNGQVPARPGPAELPADAYPPSSISRSR